MTSRTSSIAITLIAFLGLSALHAQQPSTPTLNDILQRLETNLNHYDSDLPSLFCDEHVVSQIEPNLRNRDTVTDSVFRLKRTANPDHTKALVESREIKTVNGKPPASQDIKGPTLLSGAFEGGLAVVSLSQKTCMKYTLQPINSKRATEPYVVRFRTALTRQNIADCLLQEKSTGRVFIDPASMQITRLELTTPRHTIIPGNAYEPAVVGKRTLTVDYAPVLLGGETFWLPSSIASRDIGDAATFHATVWSFRATYRNYHKTEVTSRILPGTGAP